MLTLGMLIWSRTFCRRYLRKMQEDPHDIWIKVVDREIGSIIAASNWKVYVNRKSTDAIGEFAPPWLEGESLEKSKKLCHESEAARASAMPGPFVRTYAVNALTVWVLATTAYSPQRFLRPSYLLHQRGAPTSRRRRHDAPMGLQPRRSTWIASVGRSFRRRKPFVQGIWLLRLRED